MKFIFSDSQAKYFQLMQLKDLQKVILKDAAQLIVFNVFHVLNFLENKYFKAALTQINFLM